MYEYITWFYFLTSLKVSWRPKRTLSVANHLMDKDATIQFFNTVTCRASIRAFLLVNFVYEKFLLLIYKISSTRLSQVAGANTSFGQIWSNRRL